MDVYVVIERDYDHEVTVGTFRTLARAQERIADVTKGMVWELRDGDWIAMEDEDAPLPPLPGGQRRHCYVIEAHTLG